jgi:hypothetical protein
MHFFDAADWMSARPMQFLAVIKPEGLFIDPNVSLCNSPDEWIAHTRICSRPS